MTNKQLIKKLENACVVCRDCGLKYGVYSVGCSSVWEGKCGVCDQVKPVTETRDYGYLMTGIRKLIKEDETKIKIKEQSAEVAKYMLTQEPTVTNHPITPPPELVSKWANMFEFHSDAEVFTEVAQWGADQELEACCEWFREFYKTESWVTHDLKHFRTARRPKPPSLKEQALDALREAESTGCLYVNGRSDLIRKALEALPND